MRNQILKISTFILQWLLISSALAELPNSINENEIRFAAVKSFPEYLELLTLPNDSLASAVDIQKNAIQIEKLFQKRGFETKQFPNNGKPLVLAEYCYKKNVSGDDRLCTNG